MSLHGDDLILTHRDQATVYSLPYVNIRFGALVEISRVHIVRLFSTPDIMGVSLVDGGDDDVTDGDEDVTDGDDDETEDDGEKVVMRWTGSQWEQIEGTDIKSMAYFTVLRISESNLNFYVFSIFSKFLSNSLFYGFKTFSTHISEQTQRNQ